MPVGPSGRKAKEIITFRAPADIQEWIDTMTDARRGVRRTDAIIWALQVARDYVEAVSEFGARIRAIQKVTDLTELGVIKRALSAGLAQLERDLDINPEK